MSEPALSGGIGSLTVHSPVGGVIVVNAHYKSTTSVYPGHPVDPWAGTDSAGNGTVPFAIGSPTTGYAVVVDVTIGHKAECSTEFTPQ